MTRADGKPAGTWICIDGVEGVGKTTLSNALAPRLGGAIVVGEFSNSPFGRSLRSSVQADPHFISASRLGQSLVFLGDFAELCDAQIFPAVDAGGTVIQDRGYLSKYSYQYAVLVDSVGQQAAADLLDSILSLVRVPNFILYLTAPLSIIEQRLLDRDGRVTPEQLEFIAVAEDAALRRLERAPDLPHHTLSTDQPLDEVVANALKCLEGTVRKGWMASERS